MKHRKKTALIICGITVTLAGVIVGVVGTFWWQSRPPAYDEAAHRAEVERSIGHPVRDWPKYLSVAREECHAAQKKFSYYVAASMDDGHLEQVRIDVRYLCPKRETELQHVVDTVTPGP
ncbi:hypothetical protein [Actinoallomurus iriomotensis]|nr:hypothetical protein [Actinoallomurus iriomotensis]